MQLKNYIFISAVLLVSCKHPDDNNPVIKYVYSNGGLSEDLTGEAGAENTFQIGVSDDEGLSQLKVQFSTLSGIHTHEHPDGSAQEAFLEINQGQWDTIRIANLKGKDLERQFEFFVPSTINGGWKMEVTLLDSHGNIATEERTVHFDNTQLPAISLSGITPTQDNDGIIHVSVGDSILLTGFVIDTDSLEFVTAEISNDANIHWTQEWNPLDNWTFDLNQLISPPFAEPGKYFYFISARDLSGMENTVRAEVIVE